jgi:hypothetical protein
MTALRDSARLPSPDPGEYGIAQPATGRSAPKLATAASSPPASAVRKRVAPAETSKDSISSDQDSRTAVYDIAARTVYLPNGRRLELLCDAVKRRDPRLVNFNPAGWTILPSLARTRQPVGPGGVDRPINTTVASVGKATSTTDSPARISFSLTIALAHFWQYLLEQLQNNGRRAKANQAGLFDRFMPLIAHRRGADAIMRGIWATEQQGQKT